MAKKKPSKMLQQVEAHQEAFARMERAIYNVFAETDDKFYTERYLDGLKSDLQTTLELHNKVLCRQKLYYESRESNAKKLDRILELEKELGGG